MSGKPKYTPFTIVYLAQMKTELQQMRDNTLAGGPLWGDAIQAAYFAVSSSSALCQIYAELQQMLRTFSRGQLWYDIHAAYLAVSSALCQSDAQLQRMLGTFPRGQLWYDIHAAHLAVSSALCQSDAQLQRMLGTFSRGQLWYDIHAAYLAVSSALGKIEADIKAREDNLIEADIKTREWQSSKGRFAS
jgi:hypothetical protein